jgi:hypothetical protein
MRDALIGFLRLGIFLGGCGLLMVFMQPPNSPELVVSACTAAMGISLLVGVAVLWRFMRI